MASPFNILEWYWNVLDNSPGVVVYSTFDNTFVVVADAGYAAWLALGNTATTIDTYANLKYIFELNARHVFYPSCTDETTGTHDVTLTNPPSSLVRVNPSEPGHVVTLPVMNAPNSLPPGECIRVFNISTTDTVNLNYSNGTGAVTIAALDFAEFYLLDNSSPTGISHSLVRTDTI